MNTAKTSTRQYYVLKLPQVKGELLAQMKELLQHFTQLNAPLCVLCNANNLKLAKDFIAEYAPEHLLPEVVIHKAVGIIKDLCAKSAYRMCIRKEWLTSICAGKKTMRIPVYWIHEMSEATDGHLRTI